MEKHVDLNGAKKVVAWKIAKNQGFNIKYEYELEKLVNKNLDRIEFVKDGIGLRDFLFVAMKDTEGFAYDIYCTLDVKVDPSEPFNVKSKRMEESVEYRELVCLQKIEHFFKHTNRTLYIGLGFKENLMYSEEDLKEIIGYEENPIMNEEEIIKRRKFPKWYSEVSRFPDEIFYLSKYVEIYLFDYLNKEEREVLLKEMKKANNHTLDILVETVENLQN